MKKGVCFLISKFRHVLNLVFFLLGDSPAFEFYFPTFLYTVPSSQAVEAGRRNTQSVPKCWQIKFKRQGITQNKE